MKINQVKWTCMGKYIWIILLCRASRWDLKPYI